MMSTKLQAEHTTIMGCPRYGSVGSLATEETGVSARRTLATMSRARLQLLLAHPAYCAIIFGEGHRKFVVRQRSNECTCFNMNL